MRWRFELELVLDPEQSARQQRRTDQVRIREPRRCAVLDVAALSGASFHADESRAILRPPRDIGRAESVAPAALEAVDGGRQQCVDRGGVAQLARDELAADLRQAGL